MGESVPQEAESGDDDDSDADDVDDDEEVDEPEGTVKEEGAQGLLSWDFVSCKVFPYCYLKTPVLL